MCSPLLLLVACLLALSCFVRPSLAATAASPRSRAPIVHAGDRVPLVSASAVATATDRTVKRYGESLATAGALAAIAAPTDGDDALNPGAATVLRVERRQSGAIELTHCVELTATGEADHFGASLALMRLPPTRAGSTTILAIGADRASAVRESYPIVAFAGAVEVFRNSTRESEREGEGVWIHEATLISAAAQSSDSANTGESANDDGADAPSGPESGAEFGAALATWSSAANNCAMLAIGSPRKNIDGVLDAGTVELFLRGSIEDVAGAIAHASDGAVQPRGGPIDRSHAASTDASQSTDEPGLRSAHADPWSFLTSVCAPTPQVSAWFGSAIALQGNWLIVGAPGEDQPGDETTAADDIQSCGAVHLFRRVGDAYVFARTLRAPKPAHSMWFGSSLACDNNVLAIGAPNAALEGAHVGAVYLCDLNMLETEPLRLNPPRANSGSGFGVSLALKGHQLLIGATGVAGVTAEDEPIEGVGACWLFDLETRAWKAELAPPSAHPMALFGTSCALLSLQHDDNSQSQTASTLSIAGHLYTEEESVAPSPGAAFYSTP